MEKRVVNSFRSRGIPLPTHLKYIYHGEPGREDVIPDKYFYTVSDSGSVIELLGSGGKPFLIPRSYVYKNRILSLSGMYTISKSTITKFPKFKEVNDVYLSLGSRDGVLRKELDEKNALDDFVVNLGYFNPAEDF